MLTWVARNGGGAVPFTGSHPAAVMALFGLGLPTSALVIGSLTPDLPYYFPTPVTSAQTHSLSGVLWADLVLGFGAFLVWHLLLVPPLVWAAPQALQRRIPDHLRGSLAQNLNSAKGLARVSLALVVGALTHVAWDSFTHANRWSERVLPWLDSTFLGLALIRWLHLASSLAGLALLGWFLTSWWRGAPEVGSTDPVRPVARWGLALLLLGLAGWATSQAAAAQVLAPGRVSRQMLVIDSLVEFVSTLMLGIIGAAVVWHLVRAVRTDRDRVTTGSS